MSDPYLSEIRIMSFNYAPKGWAQCNGQLLPINQNQALFSLLGTTYGGNGQTTFALPNLRGRVPIHVGSGHTLGESAGSSSVTVNTSQLPQHQHTLQASASQATTEVANNGMMTATSKAAFVYSSPQNLVAMDPTAIGNTGGSQPHENRQPFLTLNFCIALQGIFPSRN